MVRRHAVGLAFSVAFGLAAAAAQAMTVEFVPPNDPDGYSSAGIHNNGWVSGRGIGFTVTEDLWVSSVGVRHDLTDIDLAWSLSEIDALTGSFSVVRTLVSGAGLTSTEGFAWIDRSFSAVMLEAGTNYLIEFSFAGVMNTSFFYDNENEPWSQGVFANLEGTQSRSFGNYVLAPFRIGTTDAPAAVPAPAAAPLLVAALGGLAMIRRRRGG
ncbi:MAG: hypothetical protein ACU0DT_21940 [Albimonas sp.]|uniref:hypothetical protein n=1 Tax=Albimonas sp. TaxID=1872425 RepID=UPI0040561E37